MRVAEGLVAILIVGALAASCSEEPLAAPARPPLPEAGPSSSSSSSGSDGGPDAGGGSDGGDVPACDPQKPFGAPKRINELSAAIENEWSFRPAESELFGLLTRQSNTGQELLKTSRARFGDAWGLPTSIAGSSSSFATFAGDPSLATLGGVPTLFFMENVAATWRLKRVTWDPIASNASGATTDIFPSSTTSEYSPVFVEATSELWFIRDNGGALRIHRSVYTSGGAFGAAVEDAVLAKADFKQNGTMAFSRDGLTVYFGGRLATEPVDHDVDVYRATRTSKDAPFTDVTPAVEVNTTYFEQPVTITPDGCRLYLSSNRNPQGGAPSSIDVYVATRPPPP